MKKALQIDKMIDEGLGAGRINNKLDKKQLENPISKNKISGMEKDNTMARNLEDMKRLGKEMEQMKTETELKKEGKIASPKEN